MSYRIIEKPRLLDPADKSVEIKWRIVEVKKKCITPGKLAVARLTATRPEIG